MWGFSLYSLSKIIANSSCIEWLISGGKCLYRLFYQVTSLKTFTTLTNWDYSMNTFQIKPINLSLKNALAESQAKYASQAWQEQMPSEISYLCL